MSCLKTGGHTTVACSSICLRYVLKALINTAGSLVEKHIKINFACCAALVTEVTTDAQRIVFGDCSRRETQEWTAGMLHD